MVDELVLSHSVGVAVSKEIDGVEMGVLSDGRSYFTARGLAIVCGVAASAVITQGKRWLDGERKGKLAQMLVARGLEQPSLYVVVEREGTVTHAYTDDVAVVMLEYYAFETTPVSAAAQQNFRKLAQAGLRVFVYQALGYDPAQLLPQSWRNFHDRLTMHTVPSGYFSVFRECADFVLASIRAGLPSDQHTIPDISVGMTWASFWKKSGFAVKFGERVKHDHNYPDYYPQALSNPQEISVYPVDALGEFRRWLESEYLPQRFPKYLSDKSKKGLIAPSTVELLLAEVAPLLLPE